MQLFELVSPRLFRPLAGPNRAFYAELLLLLWEECRHTADYSISRAEAVSRAEDYFAALAKPLALDADGAGDEEEQPTRDPHTLAVGFLLRLRRTGWLEEQPGSYESEPTLAFMPEVTPLLDALEEILNPRVVTYTGKLYKAWQLLGSIGQEKSPYENVLREVAADLETLNKSLRALNASIGHYIDRLTHNRTPQEVLELFDQYEEKVVAAAYHRFKTSDNLFNYRAYLEEELDDCEQNQLPRLALDYARVERCAPGEAAPRVRALIQQQRDADEGDRRQPHPLPQAGGAAGTIPAAERPLGAGQRHRPAAPLCGGHPQPGAAVRAGRWPGGGAAAPVPGGSVRHKAAVSPRRAPHRSTSCPGAHRTS